MMVRTLRLLMVLLAMLALYAPALAVELDGQIKGVVTDDMGLSIPGVTVTLESPNMLGGRTQVTDTEGRYRFSPIPPGEYVVRASKGGFQNWESAPIDLPVGSTFRVDIELPTRGSAEEEITVVGDTPAVDVEATVMGANLDSDYLKHIPTAGRDYQSAISVTPGVVGGGNANMHGGFDSSNQFYIDGVNITDPTTNTFSTNMNYDAIESIQVLTGGMDAEYGRSLGGAVNIVTKSGGNQFEGTANLLYSDNSFIWAPERQGDDFDDEINQQLALNLGGPIIKDKVWFFASAQGDRAVTRVSVSPDIPRDLTRFPTQPQDWRSAYLFGKVTAQPNSSNRVWIHAQLDPTWIDNATQDPYTLPSAESVQNQGGWLGSIGHTFTPSDSVILDTQVYYQRSYIDVFSALWKHCQEFTPEGTCAHDFVGMDYLGEPVTEGWYGSFGDDFSSGELPYANFSKRTRASLNSSLTLYGDALGEHEAKVGLQAEYLFDDDIWPGSAANGEPYFTNTGDPMDLDGYVPDELYLYSNDFEARLDGTIISWYLQDVYKPHPQITLRPGLRFDYTNLRELGDSGPESLFDSLTVAPRLGAAVDLTGDGKTSLHAYYGRFYDSGFLVIASLLKKTGTSTGLYGWDADANDWEDEPRLTFAETFLVHEPLRNPYSDELNFGVSRQLGRRLAVDATFVHERARRFWEDDEVNLIWDDQSNDLIGSRNGVDEAVYRLRTPNSSFTNYTSLELSVEKGFGEQWTLLGSYTLARAYGTNSADQATGGLDTPEQREYETGLLDYDRTHTIKTSGNWVKDDVFHVGRTGAGFVAGWNFTAYSGFPYRKSYFSDFWGTYGNYYESQDGTYRTPWFSQLDLRAALHLDYYEKFNWSVGFDIFNVLNTRTTTSVNEEYDPNLPDNHPDQTFGQEFGNQFPRWAQLMVRGEF